MGFQSGCFMVFLESFRGFLWFFNGVSMGFLWVFYLSIDFLWLFYFSNMMNKKRDIETLTKSLPKGACSYQTLPASLFPRTLSLQRNF